MHDVVVCAQIGDGPAYDVDVQAGAQAEFGSRATLSMLVASAPRSPTAMVTRPPSASWWTLRNRHGLEPQGKRIEKTRFGARGLEVFVAEGPHPNSRSPSTPVWFRDLVVDPAGNGYGHRVIIGWCVDKRRSCGGRGA
ncbi:hypothetical protein [Streptomyces caeruleatus]|uniref:Uncharacterized protein n=1 Tax=Streptomyces caeruleatus TaxID=661399 RepID=A0A101U2S8_9ACTN|nr:hypothetical protein [Streptomyces caeruleatus]KUO03076.1 hypothetical protein AQJ67_18395 [Streptomyces caeruleatus]